MTTKETINTMRRRNSKAARNRGELVSAIAAHDRIQKRSDEIRKRTAQMPGWNNTGKHWCNWAETTPPLPENAIVEAWRAELAAKPARRNVAADLKAQLKVAHEVIGQLEAKLSARELVAA